ncbi:hypothetical protein JCM5353_006370 [Sporobolomyces roseus]
MYGPDDEIRRASPPPFVDQHYRQQQTHQPPPAPDDSPKLIPREEYGHEHIEELVNKLVEICHARGEIVGDWKSAFATKIKKSDVDYARTWDALRRVLDRVIRGEFLLFFSKKSGMIDAFNPIFEPTHVVVLKGELDSTINPARRPTVSSTSELVLSHYLYKQARLPAPMDMTREEFKNEINAIAVAFCQLHPKLVEVGQGWEKAVLEGGKDVGGTRWNLLGNKSVLMRWKLIVVGEKVRTGEKLPEVKDLLHGHIEPPRNVSPSDPCFVRSGPSLSLGRIGIRQARRISYVGRAARDGGVEFV